MTINLKQVHGATPPGNSTVFLWSIYSALSHLIPFPFLKNHYDFYLLISLRKIEAACRESPYILPTKSVRPPWAHTFCLFSCYYEGVVFPSPHRWPFLLTHWIWPHSRVLSPILGFPGFLCLLLHHQYFLLC